jgi:hypothetical protein
MARFVLLGDRVLDPFDRISRTGEPLYGVFAGWYVFRADRIAHRICRHRSFVFEPAS